MMTRSLCKLLYPVFGILIFCSVTQAHSEESYCISGMCTLPESVLEERLKAAFEEGVRASMKVVGNLSDCPIYIVRENSGGGSTYYEKTAYWSVYMDEVEDEISVGMQYHLGQKGSFSPNKYIFYPKDNTVKWKSFAKEPWHTVDVSTEHWRAAFGKVDPGFVSIFESLNAGVMDAMKSGDRYAIVTESQCKQR